MTLNDELKLMIHESVLDDGSKEELLSIVESTNDEEILESVCTLLEAQTDYKYMKARLDEAKQKNPKAKEVKSTEKRERKWKAKEAEAQQGAEYLDTVNAMNTIASKFGNTKTGKRLNQPFDEYEKEVDDINTKYVTSKQRERLLKNAKLKLDIKNNIVRKQVSGGRVQDGARLVSQHGDKSNKYRDIKLGNREQNFSWDNEKRKLTKMNNTVLESALEAFKEGILTESEVIEIFSEANATTKFIHQSREEAKKENSDIKKREKEIIDKIDKFDSVADTTPSDSVRAIARKKANDLLKERYKLNDKRDENEKIVNVKTSKDRGKDVSKTISDLKKQIKLNEQNGKKTDSLKNEINNIIKHAKHDGYLDKKAMNKEFGIDKNRVERKPGSFV